MLRRIVLFSAAVANLLLLDQIVKAAAISLKGSPSDVVVVVPNLFNLTYLENRGCAWGLLQGHVWPLAVFGLLALAFLLWKRRAIFGLDSPRALSARLGAVAEPLLYAGIVGNAIDRIFRRFVVDMLDFHWGASHFPCFNIADTYITVAAGVLVLLSFRHGDRK